MKKKKVWILSLVLLVAFSFAGVGAALAQDSTQTPRAALLQLFWSKLAANLGVDESWLQEAFKAAAGEILDEAARQGLLPSGRAQRLRQALNEGRWLLHLHGFRGWRAGGVLNEVTDILGMTQQELKEQLRSGPPILDIKPQRI